MPDEITMSPPLSVNHTLKSWLSVPLWLYHDSWLQGSQLASHQLIWSRAFKAMEKEILMISVFLWSHFPFSWRIEHVWNLSGFIVLSCRCKESYQPFFILSHFHDPQFKLSAFQMGSLIRSVTDKPPIFLCIGTSLTSLLVSQEHIVLFSVL